MGLQLELVNESSKIRKINIQDVYIMYLVDELMKCLLDKKPWDVQPSTLHIQN